MKIVGLSLIALGAVILIYGGITYQRERTVLEIGDLKATAKEQKSIPIPPVAGVASVLAGIGVLVLPLRKRG
ncbi:MAG: hypothetical protein U0527_03475 [Candidatus Eisenbacteria bacterium]